MDKKENKEWMEIADEILRNGNCKLFKEARKSIYSSYNGQVSALGVSILMIGLKPTIAVYYQDGDGEASRKNLLDVIAKMLNKRRNLSMENAEALTRYILGQKDDGLKTDILNCSVALKQVIRTYKLE